MSIPVLTFFNNKGGVGKTSLVYHLAWMFSELQHTVVAVDLDAQANLTAAFIEDDELEGLWEDSDEPKTIYQAIKPLTKVGDIQNPIIKKIAQGLYLIPGDVALASYEDFLSESWPKSLDSNSYRHFRILTAFWWVAQESAKKVGADLILMDVGPNLGAINRSALIASDFVFIPLGADIFSLQGLKNLGPTLRDWRSGWQKRRDTWNSTDFDLPQGEMKPLGYIVQQYIERRKRPVKAYDQWICRIPAVYHKAVLEDCDGTSVTMPAQDTECLMTLRHYRSLIPMGQETRKPIFHLTPADGAIGSHAQAVQEAYNDFKTLAGKIEERIKRVQPG